MSIKKCSLNHLSYEKEAIYIEAILEIKEY